MRTKEDLAKLRKQIETQRKQEREAAAKAQIESAKQGIPEPGVDLIKDFEKCHLKAYPDPRTKGRPYTIGWGSTFKLDGTRFELGETISQAEADLLFYNQLKNVYLPGVKRIPGFSQMTKEMQGALLSFAYNLSGSFYGQRGFETITRLLKAKNWKAVPKALYMYRNPGTEVEAGLARRRKEEGQLWTRGLRKLGLA